MGKRGPKPKPDAAPRHPEWGVWKGMRRRCLRPQHSDYWHYGGRGITICERWNTFWKFLADMGPRPSPKHEIERIDNNKGYEPSNCRWATRREQTRNKRNTHWLTWQDKTKSLAEWAELTGLPYSTLRRRKYCGWTDEDTLTTPINPRRSAATKAALPQAEAKRAAQRTAKKAIPGRAQ